MKFSTSSAHTCFDYLFHVPRSPFVISRQLLGQLFPVLYRAERLYSNMKYLSVSNSFFISFFLFLSIIRFEKLLFIEIFPSIEVKMENNICNKKEQKYITKKKEKSRIIIHFQTDISIIRLRSIRKHCRKRPLNRDGLIDSLARYARSRRTRNVRRSGGTRPIDSSVHRHARQVTRRGRSRNCHAEAREVCVYSLARSVPAWPVATLVL